MNIDGDVIQLGVKYVESVQGEDDAAEELVRDSQLALCGES